MEVRLSGWDRYGRRSSNDQQLGARCQERATDSGGDGGGGGGGDTAAGAADRQRGG